MLNNDLVIYFHWFLLFIGARFHWSTFRRCEVSSAHCCSIHSNFRLGTWNSSRTHMWIHGSLLDLLRSLVWHRCLCIWWGVKVRSRGLLCRRCRFWRRTLIHFSWGYVWLRVPVVSIHRCIQIIVSGLLHSVSASSAGGLERRCTFVVLRQRLELTTQIEDWLASRDFYSVA